MPDITVIQPQELSTTDFVYSDGLFKLTKPAVSTDATNAIVAGTDGAAFLAASNLKKYRIVQDPLTSSILLYEYTGDDFEVSTATLLDTVSVSLLIDDIAISGTILTFTDIQSKQSLIFDTALPLYSIFSEASSSITATGNGKDTALVLDLVVDPVLGNLLKVSASGAAVDTADVIAAVNTHLTQTLTLVNSKDTGVVSLTVGSAVATVPTSRLLNSAGQVLGYLLAE